MDPYKSPKSKSQYSEGGSISGLLLFENAVTELARNWRTLLTASIFPLLCSSLVQAAGFAYFQSKMNNGTAESIGFYSLLSFGFFLASVPFYVMFATNCHRIILLGEHSIPNRFGLYWSGNQTRFLGWVVLVGIIGGLIAFPAMLVPALLLAFGFDVLELPMWLFSYVGVLISTYFEGRLGLVLPATAVGKRLNLRDSWGLTRSVGWAVFFALLIPIVMIKAIKFVLSKEMTDMSKPAMFLVEQVVFYPLIAIGVAVLTIVYRDFGSESQDGDDIRHR